MNFFLIVFLFSVFLFFVWVFVIVPPYEGTGGGQLSVNTVYIVDKKNYYYLFVKGYIFFVLISITCVLIYIVQLVIRIIKSEFKRQYL